MKVVQHREHIRSLDGIRGIAILLVLYCHFYPRGRHTMLASLANFGWIGVDLFFVLSGFLITGILYDTRRQNGFFRKFYARRALRLFPVYLAMCVLVLAVGAVHGVKLTRYTLPFLLYFSNIFGGFPSLGIWRGFDLGHLWSLALEEQFYLIWPPLLYALKTRRRMMQACVIGILLANAFRLWMLWHPPGIYPWVQLPARMDSLMMGGLLALALRSEGLARWLTVKRLYAVAAAALAVVLACVLRAHTFWLTRFMILYGLLGLAVLFAACIALATREGTFVRRVGEIKVLGVFGRYSYGLYLWHNLPYLFVYPLIDRINSRFPFLGLAGTGAFLVAVAASLGVAVASYHVIELPFLKLKRRFSYSDEQRAGRVRVDSHIVEGAQPGA